MEIHFHLFSDRAPVVFVHRNTDDVPQNHHLHLNPHIELFRYRSGDVEYMVQNRLYPLSSGDLVVLPPYAVHMANLKTPSHHDRSYFLLPTDLFDRFPFDPIDYLVRMEKETSPLIRFSAADSEKLDGIQKTLECIAEDQDSTEQGIIHLSPQASIKAGALLISYLDICVNAMSKSQLSEIGKEKNLPETVYTALRYTEMHLCEIASVKEIAKACGVSAPYLSALFRRTVGVAPLDYLRAHRIAFAKKRLENGVTVTEACFESGFSDCSYFIKCFHHYTGQTPRQYAQNNHRN